MIDKQVRKNKNNVLTGLVNVNCNSGLQKDDRNDNYVYTVFRPHITQIHTYVHFYIGGTFVL